MSDTQRDENLTELLSDLWVAARVGTVEECNKAHAAIVKYVAGIRSAAEATRRERDTWKGHAIALGVNGKAERDTSRNLLTLSMRVDEGVLRYGTVDVLTATLLNMRTQYEHAIAAARAERA